MRSGFLLGFILSFCLGLFLIAIILKITKTDKASRCRYDERQQQQRGVGFKYAFFTLVIYNSLYASLGLISEKVFMDTPTGCITGVLLGVFVYALYGIRHESYLSLNENPKRVIIAFILIGAINLILAAVNIFQHRMIENGILTFHILNLFCGIMIVVIALAIIIRQYQLKNEVD